MPKALSDQRQAQYNDPLIVNGDISDHPPENPLGNRSIYDEGTSEDKPSNPGIDGICFKGLGEKKPKRQDLTRQTKDSIDNSHEGNRITKSE